MWTGICRSRQHQQNKTYFLSSEAACRMCQPVSVSSALVNERLFHHVAAQEHSVSSSQLTVVMHFAQ